MSGKIMAEFPDEWCDPPAQRLADKIDEEIVEQMKEANKNTKHYGPFKLLAGEEELMAEDKYNNEFKCEFCGGIHYSKEDHAKHCLKQKICPQCDHIIIANSFCSKCGKS